MILEISTFAFRSGDKTPVKTDLWKIKKYNRLTKSLVYPLIEKYYRRGNLPSVFYRWKGLNESQFYT